MKRILCAILALTMLAGFAGCKQNAAETEPIMASSEEFTEETIEETEEETEELTEEETEEESTEPTETTEATVPPCANHSWGYWVQLEAPTTSAEGKRVRTCTVCGTEDVEVLEKLPKASSHKHKYKTETSKATCKEEGWVYYHCDCGDWYQVNEKAKDHTWGAWKVTTPATKEKSGEKTRTCKVCKETETEALPYCKTHNWGDWKLTKNAINGNPGQETRTCKTCGGKEVRDIPDCGEGKHTFAWYQIKPTCVDGQRYQRCKRCGYKDESTVQPLPATQEHKWGSWTVTKPATTESAGKRKHTCSVCQKTEEVDIPEHTHKGTMVVTKEATCTEDGLKEGICTECEKEISETIPALGHDFGDWAVSEEDPTKEVRKCQREGCSETETRDIQSSSTPETSDPSDSEEE